MAILTEEQWELDGYVFGAHKPVFVVQSGFDPGSAAIRTQDASRAGADGLMFGRDYIDGPKWQFTLGVEDKTDVWQVIAELTAQWRPATRLAPGAFSTLRHMRNGSTFRVYGRPREFAVKPAIWKNDRFQRVDCTFQLAEACMYAETNQSANTATLTLRPSTATGGLIFPVTFPVIFGSGTLSRANGVSINAITASPFTVTVHPPLTGALTGISLSGTGWTLSTSVAISGSDTLVIDTRAQTIQKNGQNIPGTLTTTSNLAARLTPGAQVISFTGNDPSNTARAVFSWFDAIPL